MGPPGVSSYSDVKEWGLEATKPTIHQILELLQVGLEMGLSTSPLHRQVAAINSTLGAGLGPNFLAHPHIKRFLKGVALLNPPVVHRFPTWALHVVLQGLRGSSFEPLAKVPLKLLTVKTLFLVAITSARRVSEIWALSVNPRLCVFHKD